MSLTTKRVNMIRELQNPKNWLPQFKKISEKSDVDPKTVKKYYEDAQKVGRLRFSVDILTDEELADLQREMEGDINGRDQEEFRN